MESHSNVTINMVEPILTDDRGSLIEVMNGQNVRHIVVTISKQGAIRGNQYRAKMDQFFYLVTGKMMLITENIVSKQRKETLLQAGSLVYIPRNIAFAAKALEDSILLEYSEQEFVPTEPDINKYTLISKKE